MSVAERNYVGEITLEYFPDDEPWVRLKIDEVGATLLTMDQVDSFAAILRDWITKYHAAEQAIWDTRRTRKENKEEKS